MKKKELIEKISKTQDSNVLVKGFSHDDFLSQYIMNAINYDIGEEVKEDDLCSLSASLSYAIEQLKRAREAVDEVIESEEKSKKPFEVNVCRIGYAYKTITVLAKTRKEAEEIALDEAGGEEFSEKNADYNIAD